MESASASPNSSRLGAEQLHALRRRFRADHRIPLPDRGPGREREGDGACPPRQGHSCFEHLLHPCPRLGHEAPDPPVEEGLPYGFCDHVAGADRDEVPVRGAQVVPLGFESRDGGGLGRTSELRLGRHGEVDVEVGVSAAHCSGILTLPEPGGRELPHGNEHGEERHPRRSCWRTRLPSTSSRSVPTRSVAHGAPAVTASAASRLKSPENTPRHVNIDFASGLSRSMLHSTVARIVRCRSGTSRAPVVRSGRTRSSRASIAEGVRARMWAAASSSASGTPSSAWQMCATSAAFSAVRSNRGSAARARSRNNRTAGAAEQLLDRGLGVFLRKSKGFDVEDVLAPHAQPGAARHEERRAGEGGHQGEDIHGGREHLLEVVEHDEVAAAGARRPDLLVEGAVARVAHPEVAGDRRQHVGGLAHLREADERHAVESVLREPGDLDGEAGLADAARADEGDEALHIPAQPVQEGCDRRLAADGVRGRRGDTAREGGHVGGGSGTASDVRGRLRAGRVEPLGEQGREVGRRPALRAPRRWRRACTTRCRHRGSAP